MHNIALDKTLYGYKNIFHGLYLVFKNEGFLALYKGAGLRVLTSIPAYTISMSLTEAFRNIIIQNHLVDRYA